MPEIVFHQQIISPHATALVRELAELGLNVTYTATHQTRADRARLGWSIPDLGRARLQMLSDVKAVRQFLDSTPVNAVHICEGLRGNGVVGTIQRELRSRGQKYWARLETIDDRGIKGFVRRVVYKELLSQRRRDLLGVLAVGQSTPRWIIDRGVDSRLVFPFTYFLEPAKVDSLGCPDSSRFRFIYVGTLRPLKRVDLLIDALARLGLGVELFIVGSGVLERELRDKARRLLGDRVVFLGSRPMAEIPWLMSKADCLVLPSMHDGWGAVVSEALMAGTPVVCSSACGASEAVEASGIGGVFKSGDCFDLVKCLEAVRSRGRLSRDQRKSLAVWAGAFSGEAGAKYLLEIIAWCGVGGTRPIPPWRRINLQDHLAQRD